MCCLITQAKDETLSKLKKTHNSQRIQTQDGKKTILHFSQLNTMLEIECIMQLKLANYEVYQEIR